MAGVASSSLGSFAAAATSPSTRRIHGGLVVRDSLPYASAVPPPPPPQVQAPSGGGGKISPAVLFIIVILAVVFFVSGLLHLLVRLLMKKQHRRRGGSAAAARGSGEAAGADAALQRQLQQLFHLHDAGLDQAFIDALPVFAYREIVVGCGGDGDKEPFDCAVCLCEFDAEDRLRLLPLCGHAFHLHCIDTWLLSNSTCPLCRGVLFAPGLTAENSPMFDFEEGFEEGRLSEDCEDGFGLSGHKASEGLQTPVAEKTVFPVRLGKFKNVGTQGAVEGGNANGAVLRREEGESSSSSLDARRCFSMGTYQYVLGTSELRVALQPDRTRNGVGFDTLWNWTVYTPTTNVHGKKGLTTDRNFLHLILFKRGIKHAKAKIPITCHKIGTPAEIRQSKPRVSHVKQGNAQARNKTFANLCPAISISEDRTAEAASSDSAAARR